MAKATLPTNYQDDVLKSTMGGKRRYTMTDNSDGTKTIEDATQYDKVGSNFGAADINKTNTAVNASADASKIIDNIDDIAANTQAGYMAGALALKKINSDLSGFQFRDNAGTPEFKAGADTAWVPFSRFVISRIDTGTGNGNVNQSYNNVYIPGKRKITIGHVGIVNPDHYNKTMTFTIYDGDGKQLYTTTSPVDNITVTADAITTFKVYLYGWQTYATDIVAE